MRIDLRAYDVMFTGNKNTGDGTTSKTISETAICLPKQIHQVGRLRQHAGLTFVLEAPSK